MRPDEYRKLAEAEDQMWYFRALHSHVRTALGDAEMDQRPAVVLDDGCGTGGLLSRLYAKDPQWKFYGLDYSPQACELATVRCGRFARISQGSAVRLPYEDAMFDAVVSADVICQLENPLLAFKEIWRVLKPGGCAILNAPAYQWMWSYHDEACQSVRRFAREEFRELFRRAGFEVTRVTHWNALPFPAVWFKRKFLSVERNASDIRVEKPWLEKSMDGVMAAERAWLKWGDWAWGTSLFGVGRKPPWSESTSASRPVGTFRP